AFTATFPIYDADGDLVSAAASLDSEVSKDGGTFTDVSPGEATEIATSSGVYTLALSATEMNADIVATITKTSTGGAKTAVNVMYTVTRQLVDLAFPVVSGRGIDVEATGEVGLNLDNTTGALGTAEFDADFLTAALIADNAFVAANFSAGAIDANAIAADAIGASEIANGAIDAATFAAGAINAAAIATDAVDADALAADALAEINTEVDTALADIDLDHLIQVAAGAENPTVDSYLDWILNKDGSQTFAPATDSLEAQLDSRPTNFSSMGIEADGHVHGDVKEWLGVAPNALVSGRVDSSVGAMAAAVITAAAHAANSVDANALANDAALEIADAVLERDLDQVEATMALHSLGTACLKAVSRIRDNAGTLETYRTNGSTLHMSQTVTTDAANDPVDELTIGT
ncbi:MAG: hypothetical protein ACXABY_24845, partial [Candidatus Thorarchaeota archaeon]